MKIISIRKPLRADIRYSTILADRQPFQKNCAIKESTFHVSGYYKVVLIWCIHNTSQNLQLMIIVRS